MEGNCGVTINTNQFCIKWLKPYGGDAIDEYIVEWSTEVGYMNSTKLDHVRGQSIYSYTINGLFFGKNITTNVIAKNVAGKGRSLQRSCNTGINLFVF